MGRRQRRIFRFPRLFGGDEQGLGERSRHGGTSGRGRRISAQLQLHGRISRKGEMHLNAFPWRDISYIIYRYWPLWQTVSDSLGLVTRVVPYIKLKIQA